MSDVALRAEGLNLYLDAKGRRLHVVRDVELTLSRAEVVGLIGESGSGKTMTGMSLLRLEPEHSEMAAGELTLGGTDLLRASREALRMLRGRRIAMIFQDPVGAFNPAKRIDWHVRQVLRRDGTVQDWRAKARSMLAEVEITDHGRVLAAYPHELSGGMLQRVLIALVLAAEPQVIVADEPTTNLDNIVERQILRLFRTMKQKHGAAFLFITHDMSVAVALSDRIAVMYAGQIVEIGAARAMFDAPLHPYTRGLIATARALTEGTERLPEIGGELPTLASSYAGCAFAARCDRRRPECELTTIGMTQLEGGRSVRCLLYE